MNIKDLEPRSVFKYFEEITQVPRPSKKEEKILSYLQEFAKKRNLEYDQDDTGNIVIRKPATKGYEDREIVVLQSHVDMVCEKNSDKIHDFDNDPITTVVDGEWLKADGTTLGADDGIGMAAALAILDTDNLEHGPIEALFTVDEETGLTGAMGLAPGLIKGKILINLDSEDEGEMFIGCAGGMGTMGFFRYKTEETPKDLFFVKIAVSGLKGGHSGGDIHVGLGNANKILARILHEISKEMPIRLSSIDGGNLHNAIPREAHAIVGIPSNEKENVSGIVNHLSADIEKELSKVDGDVKVAISSCEAPKTVIDVDTAKRLLRCLFIMPHGVMGMSHEIEGLVETSTNLAAVKMPEKGLISIETSQRSSVESQKRHIGDLVKEIFELSGAETEVRDGYPGWAPDSASPILQVTVDAYEKIFGRKPLVKAIHAGLECGLFLEKYPYLDMVSFGPTLRDVHSPQERLEIKTVDMFWKHLLEVLRNIPLKK